MPRRKSQTPYREREATSLRGSRSLKGRCATDTFFEGLELPKVTRKRNGNPNSPVTIKEIKFTVKNLATKTTPGPGGFTDESCYTLRRKENQLYPIPSTK